MKLMLTILTTNNIEKLVRLVNNISDIIRVPELELCPIIVVNSTNPNYFQEVLRLKLPYPVIKTESNGLPGKGKNSCLDLFLKSDCDFISQIDGDDLLYPSYLKSLYNHIKQFPSIDVLGVIPTDIINHKVSVGHIINISESLQAGVWGVSLVTPSKRLGIGESHIWSENLPKSTDFIILQSKKSATIKMSETLPVAEDHLYSYQLLAEHQKGNLSYFLTMSSDLYIVDRTTEGSVQKTHKQQDSVDSFKHEVSKILPRWRSSIWELPIVYKDLLMSHIDKEIWLKKFLSKA